MQLNPLIKKYLLFSLLLTIPTFLLYSLLASENFQYLPRYVNNYNGDYILYNVSYYIFQRMDTVLIFTTVFSTLLNIMIFSEIKGSGFISVLPIKRASLYKYAIVSGVVYVTLSYILAFAIFSLTFMALDFKAVINIIQSDIIRYFVIHFFLSQFLYVFQSFCNCLFRNVLIAALTAYSALLAPLLIMSSANRFIFALNLEKTGNAINNFYNTTYGYFFMSIGRIHNRIYGYRGLYDSDTDLYYNEYILILVLLLLVLVTVAVYLLGKKLFSEKNAVMSGLFIFKWVYRLTQCGFITCLASLFVILGPTGAGVDYADNTVQILFVFAFTGLMFGMFLFKKAMQMWNY